MLGGILIANCIQTIKASVWIWSQGKGWTRMELSIEEKMEPLEEPGLPARSSGRLN